MATLRPAVWLAATKIGNGSLYLWPLPFFQPQPDSGVFGPLACGAVDERRSLAAQDFAPSFMPLAGNWFDVCLQTARRRAAAAGHSPAERSQSAMKPQEKLKGLSLC